MRFTGGFFPDGTVGKRDPSAETQYMSTGRASAAALSDSTFTDWKADLRKSQPPWSPMRRQNSEESGAAVGGEGLEETKGEGSVEAGAEAGKGAGGEGAAAKTKAKGYQAWQPAPNQPDFKFGLDDTHVLTTVNTTQRKPADQARPRERSGRASANQFPMGSRQIRRPRTQERAQTAPAPRSSRENVKTSANTTMDAAQRGGKTPSLKRERSTTIMMSRRDSQSRGRLAATVPAHPASTSSESSPARIWRGGSLEFLRWAGAACREPIPEAAALAVEVFAPKLESLAKVTSCQWAKLGIHPSVVSSRVAPSLTLCAAGADAPLLRVNHPEFARAQCSHPTYQPLGPFVGRVGDRHLARALRL